MTDNLMDVAKGLPSMLVEFGKLGVPGWIAAAVLLVLMGVGGYFLWRWVKKRAVEKSNRDNERRREDAEAGLPSEQARIERGVRESVRRLRDRVTLKSQIADLGITVTDVECPSHGKFRTRTKMPKGVVIHYTAGRAAYDREGAEKELRSMAEAGCGALIVDKNGALYAPRGYSGKEVYLHAGDSKWLGVKNLDRHCVGLELCCAGLLDENNQSWFGHNYPPSIVRVVGARDGNRKPGHYHMFSEAQEKTIIAFCVWHLLRNPEFEVEWVVGHDEIAPARKSDPGGSLSVTMPEFRRKLKIEYEQAVAQI